MFEEGSKLKTIGERAFEYCGSLKNIQFPDCFETIGINCFWGSGLEEIVLPASVKNIGSGVFRECK